MIRFPLAFSLLTLGTPILADTITGRARIDTVTIYPGMATVTREVTLSVPAGSHDVIVPELPQGLDAQGLRLSADADVLIGAVILARGRLPVTPDQISPAVQVAMDEVERLEGVLRDRDAAIAEIRLRVEAANEQIAFLQSLSQASAGETLTAATIADIQALARMVGAETLAVRQTAFTAEKEAKAAELAREDDVEALEKARKALDVLVAPQTDTSALTFTLEAAVAQEVVVTFSTIEGFANWSPVYDMHLTTTGEPTLDIARSVVVSQQTGQDWLDVNLILSTARPGEQTGPSPVFSYPRRIISKEELEREELQRNGIAFDTAMAPEAMVMAEGAAPMFREVAATADLSGATVTYVYPGRVDIRDGVEDLRLPLDRLEIDVAVRAEAAPVSDPVAYRVATFTNKSPELLLPGRALMFTDGTMVGFGDLPLIAAGAETEMGFGPLDGLRLTRVIPSRSEGDRGVFSTANALTEAAVIRIENLTGQDWDVLLRDAVPYSEQDDLEVEIAATPPVTRIDPEGARGILEWDIAVPAGETRQVDLTYTLKWPAGYVLQ